MSKSLNHISPQRKTEAYQRIENILENGPYVPAIGAVHWGHFLDALCWSQAGARISEINDLGWQIASGTVPKSEWENGIRTADQLDSKPLQPQAPKTKSDCMRRARQDRERTMPLFARVETEA